MGPMVVILPGVEVGTSFLFLIKFSLGMLKSIPSENLFLLRAFSCGLSLTPADLFLLTGGGSSGLVRAP